MMQDKTWATEAACRDCEPDALFVRGAAQRSARMICYQCPVRIDCLVDALDSNSSFGVWGGITERERRAVLKRYPNERNWHGRITQGADALALEIRAPRPPRIGQIGLR